MLTLGDILGVKGRSVYSIEPEATLAQAVKKLAEHNVGSLLVLRKTASGEEVAGILTERDLLHWCASTECQLAQVTVAEVMSKDLITARPSDAVETVMGLMTNRRIRHVPVLDRGKLVGVVSIGDVVKAQHDHLAMENQFMKNYIQG